MNGSNISAAYNLTFNGGSVALDASWSVGGLGDFNLDGRTDILLHNSTSGSFVDWTMSGSGITAAQSLTFNGAPVAFDPSWSIVAIDNFSGNGNGDILLRNNTNGSFVDWSMVGSAIISA